MKLTKKQWIYTGIGAVVIVSAIIFRKEIQAQYDKVIAKLK